jgi:alkylation response protein AidB-like acyl-CoA dehydrogenase
MAMALSDADGQLVERVARLTREKIGPRAAQYDRDAVNPLESWRDLWEAGFLAMAVPRRYGGLEVAMPVYAEILRAIAQGCASTSMTLHMHSTVMRFLDALATEDQKRRYYAEVTERGRLFGSWGSEPAVSLSRALQFETSIRRKDGSWVIDGTKHFCTMARGAAYYLVWGALDGLTDMAKALMVCLVPADTPGIAIDDRWDTLGMRATYSPSVTFTGCAVAGDSAIGEPGGALRAGVIEGFALGYAAIYLGIAQSALDFAVEYAKKRVMKPDPLPIAHEPATQRHVGELTIKLEAAGLVLARAAEEWASAGAVQRGVLAAKAKYVTTESGLLVTSKVIQLVGGRGAYRDHPVERAFRDLRTCTLMVPSVDRMAETIGKSVLGLDGAMFNVAAGTPPAS